MVKLKRLIYCERVKDTPKKVSNNSKILSNIRSIMEEECAPLDTLLSESVQKKITVSNSVPLSSLYTTVSDAGLIEDFVSQSKDSSPMSPAYVLSHLQDADPESNGVVLSYKGKNIINPRLFLLLNRQFKKINKDSQCKANLLFNKESHTDAYSLYTESADYPLIIELQYPSEEKQFVIKDSFSDILKYLEDSKKDTTKLQRSIKDAETFLSQFRDIKSPSIDKKRNELEELKQELDKSLFDIQILSSIQKAISTVSSTPKVSNGKFSEDIGKYRNEGILCLAIDKDNLGEKDRLQSHIVVSLHLQKKTKNSYVLTCYANALSDVEGLHVSDDHLLL